MMNEQTRNLEKWIAGMVSSDCYNCEEDVCGGDDDPRCTMDYKQAHQILKACKEARLIFKHDCQNCPKREEDGFGLLCVLTCAEPFEEIDV